MSITGLLFLIVMHFFAGRGILFLFSIRLKPMAMFALSGILGVMVVSLIPMILDLLHIPLSKRNVVIAILSISAVLNITRLRKIDITILKSPGKFIKKVSVYDVFFITLFGLLLIPSLWRSFYYPPYARDILSGPEIIAEFAVKEKTMINSVFSLNLETTNNHLKPPFIAGLQIVYKMLVYPFGQLWINVMVISFLLWLYSLLTEKLHPIIAGLCLLLFVAIPEMYAYTYIILFDYPNAVLLFVGVYFLILFAGNSRSGYFFFASLMFGFATFIRSETPVLVYMLLPMILLLFYRMKFSFIKASIHTAVFIILPFAFYYIWMGIFIKYYLPVQFDVGTQINTDLSKISVFLDRLTNLTAGYMFGGQNRTMYACFIDVFCAFLFVDLVFYRKKLNTEAKILLYSILVVYFGIPLLGFLIPWYDLEHTSKRALFKLFPLMLLYMRNSGFLQHVSKVLYEWEVIQQKQVSFTNAVNKIPNGQRPKAKRKK